MKKKLDYEISSGNVFADLELPDAEDMRVKADLAIGINTLIKAKKLNQTQAAKLLDIDQPKISALNRGRLSGFSIERLFRFLNILDSDITIQITPKKRSRKKAKVSVSLPTGSKKKPVTNKRPSSNEGIVIHAKTKKAKKKLSGKK